MRDIIYECTLYDIFRHLAGRDEGPVVVAVNTGSEEVIANIRELNPTGNENAIFAIRSVGSENPDTIVGFVNFFFEIGTFSF